MSDGAASSVHTDHLAVSKLVAALYRAAGGEVRFSAEIPQILRRALDEVIDAPRTNRFTISEIEKTEKTYLGTKIEILVRWFLNLPKGKILDLSLGGVEVDIKNTIGGNWTIPMEAVSHPCLLFKENERTARCSVGLIIAKEEYLNAGRNRDAKRTFSSAGLANVWWLLKEHPYPQNFWETLSPEVRANVMAAGGGTLRLAALFRAVQKRPISRSIVQAVGQQDDYMKRVRRNGGARDILAPEGIAILWGQKDKAIIEKVGLPSIGPDEFISFEALEPDDIALLRAARHID
jgi:hypothetical protein